MRNNIKMKKPELLYIFSFIIILIHLSAFLSGCSREDKLETITPEKAGFSSEKLYKVSEYAAEIGTGAITALFNGRIFYSWGNISENYPCHSIRKPFLGALYSIYSSRADKKIIEINSTLKELSIDDIPPELTEEEKKASVRDLLMSRSGIYHEAAAESEKMKRLRPERGSRPPGTFFYYNNWDFNALGTIFEKTTGENIFRSFKKEIADRIGMEDFLLRNCSCRYEKELSQHPAYIFKMSARDMARFGLLYMNYGKWNGEEIVPEKWIRESTRSYSFKCLNGDDYGYLWSIIPETDFPGGGFYHTGFNNHFLGILPGEELVLVYRGNEDRTVKHDAGEMRKILFMFYGAKIK